MMRKSPKMKYPIDNVEIAKSNLLRFDGEGEFYMVLVLKRRKDAKGKMAEGVNEDNRLIKHYFVYDKEYLEKKRDAIKALCEQNNARASQKFFSFMVIRNSCMKTSSLIGIYVSSCFIR